ncbi:MAG TPA: HAD family phosphatase [Verrucomicrobiae bacterium]|jgi:putative hydrolase of the HAD superfamily
MKTPEAVVFDLGKVLVDFDYGISAAKIAPLSRFTPQQIRGLLDHSPLLYRFETGLLTNEQFYTEVCAACGFSGTMDDFSACFADIFSEIPAMTTMQSALRAHGVPTYIFSNTNGIAVPHIRKNFPFFANFNGYVYSYEHKAMKPTAAIYEVVEKMTNCKGDQIVYLDDRLENYEAGRDRGWQAIFHKTPEESIPVLRRMGLPVDD